MLSCPQRLLKTCVWRLRFTVYNFFVTFSVRNFAAYWRNILFWQLPKPTIIMFSSFSTTQNSARTEFAATRSLRRMGSMRTQNQGHTRLDRQDETIAGFTTAQEETATRSIGLLRENTGGHQCTEDQTAFIYRKIGGECCFLLDATPWHNLFYNCKQLC